MQCQFCDKVFTSHKILINHQRTAKYCLAVQNANPIETPKNHDCEFCGKEFTRKYVLDRHLLKCKDKIAYELNEQINQISEKLDKIAAEKDKIISKKDAIIARKTAIISRKDAFIKSLKQKILALEKECSKSIGKIEVYQTIKPGTTINATNVAVSVNEKLAAIPIDGIRPLTIEYIKDEVAGYTYDLFCKGLPGLVKFILSIIEKEVQGDDEPIPRNYACTNQKLNKFHRLLESKKWKPDGGAKYLSKILDELIPLVKEYYDILLENVKKVDSKPETQGNLDYAVENVRVIRRGILTAEGPSREKLHTALKNKLAEKIVV